MEHNLPPLSSPSPPPPPSLPKRSIRVAYEVTRVEGLREGDSEGDGEGVFDGVADDDDDGVEGGGAEDASADGDGQGHTTINRGGERGWWHRRTAEGGHGRR